MQTTVVTNVPSTATAVVGCGGDTGIACPVETETPTPSQYVPPSTMTTSVMACYNGNCGGYYYPPAPSNGTSTPSNGTSVPTTIIPPLPAYTGAGYKTEAGFGVLAAGLIAAVMLI